MAAGPGTGQERAQTIWVVDDDPELRRMVGTYLIDQGYDVRCLADGAQLMARLAGQRPDLVVLDLMLPGDDGLSLLRRLRDAGDDLPVVMLTAKGDAIDRIIGLEQGADDYLAKPFLPRELTARIEAVLRRRVALPAGTPQAGGERVTIGELVIDLAARTLERPQAEQGAQITVLTSGGIRPAGRLRTPPAPAPVTGTAGGARPRAGISHRQPQHGCAAIAAAQAGGTRSQPSSLLADGMGLRLRVRARWPASQSLSVRWWGWGLPC